MSGTRSDVRSDVRADARADEGVGGILYGMWWDENSSGNYVSLPIDGESGMIFETTMQNTASKVIGALSDANGGTYFGYFLDGGSGGTGAHDGNPAYYVDGVLVASDQDDLHDALSDGFPHALRVTGLNLSHADWTQMILGGYSASFIPEGTFRDVVLRQSDETIVGSWSGYGNTNADWLDKGTGDVGMWFDGVNDKVLFDGSPFNTKTKGRITGSFQTSSSGYHNIWSLTDETDTGADVSVYLNGGKFYLTVRTAPGVNIIYAHTDAATFADGANHTFDVQVDASGNTIKVDGVTQAVTYVAGNSSTVAWADDVDDIDILSVGIRQESTPDGVFDGVVRDLVLYDEDGTTPLWSVNGYGNTNADWTDKVGSNDGTVSGSPSRAVSTATGWREANDGTVAGSPSRAVSTDGGTTWAEES